MSIPEKSSLDELPYGEEVLWLREFSSRCLGLAHAFSGPIRKDDPAQLLAVTYLNRAGIHMYSLLELGGLKDMMLVGRSLLEGWSQLIWVLEDQDRRAAQWLLFECVEDWRAAKMLEEKGRPLSDSEVAGILERLGEQGSAFLKKNKSLPVALEGSDPFEWSWTKKRPGDLIKLLPSEYRSLWNSWSDYHHWGPGETSAIRVVTDKGYQFFAKSTRDQAIVLASAADCFIEIMRSALEILGAGMLAQIESLTTELQGWAKERVARRQLMKARAKGNGEMIVERCREHWDKAMALMEEEERIGREIRGLSPPLASEPLSEAKGKDGPAYTPELLRKVSDLHEQQKLAREGWVSAMYDYQECAKGS